MAWRLGRRKRTLASATFWSVIPLLPVVFVVTNNQWAISVPLRLQTASETLAQKAIAAGFIGEQVDGNDVVAMHAAAEAAIDAARNGRGPRFIEAVTYRLGDHTTADDAARYRPPEEVQARWKEEPIARLRSYLAGQNVWSKSGLPPKYSSASTWRSSAIWLWSHGHPRPYSIISTPSCRRPMPHSAANSKGRLMTEVTLVEAVNLALARAMEDDPSVVVLGEDVGVNGGVFRATVGLQQRFGSERVFDTPLAELLISGLCVGMAAQGLKPVGEIQFMGFIYPCID